MQTNRPNLKGEPLTAPVCDWSPYVFLLRISADFFLSGMEAHVEAVLECPAVKYKIVDWRDKEDSEDETDVSVTSLRKMMMAREPLQRDLYDLSVFSLR